MKRLAIFASGTGSNAKKIIEYFKSSAEASVQLVVSNKADAPVLDMAASHGVATRMVDRALFYQTEELLKELGQQGINFIILAGFLWLIPSYLVEHYKNRIINIHPALLPKYGGKGMYGMHVHRAVKAAQESESGITIHYVNERYDEGDIIFQKHCTLNKEDSPEQIAKKVQRLEHQYFAPVIENVLKEL